MLLTGAAGRVARLVAPLLRNEFRLRRLDFRSQQAEADDEVVEADIRDIDALQQACVGVTAVVHLAAQPSEADFRSTLLPRNLDGAWAAFEAAAGARVPRLIFASTIQTVDGNPLESFVRPDAPPRPITVYACTKLFGEALGRLYADTSVLGVACLRLGGVTTADDPRLARDERFRSVWCGPVDLARLITAAIRSDLPFATVIAVSTPGMSRFDTSNPFGWVPAERPVCPSSEA